MINEVAKENKSVVIEDAAQAMGAMYRKEKVGTIADSGFFSFGRGKPLTSLDGGAIVTNDSNIAQKCQVISDNFSKQGKVNWSKMFLKLNGYSLIRNRKIYRFIHNIARNENTRFNININNVETKYTHFQANLANIQISKLDAFNNIRKDNSNIIYNALKNNKNIKLLKIGSHTDPIFLRYPIRVDTSIRKELMEQLQNNGFETSIVYPIALPKLYNCSLACQNTEDVIKETIALPVHPQVTKNDIETMLKVICNTV
jgi:dTDP-4-amino-4,6-dideoxygalactose transaminase